MNIPIELREKIKEYNLLIHNSIDENLQSNIKPGEYFGLEEKAKKGHNQNFDYNSLMILLSIIYMDKMIGKKSNAYYYKQYKLDCAFKNLKCSVKEFKKILEVFDLLPDNFYKFV